MTGPLMSPKDRARVLALHLAKDPTDVDHVRLAAAHSLLLVPARDYALSELEEQTEAGYPEHPAIPFETWNTVLGLLNDAIDHERLWTTTQDLLPFLGDPLQNPAPSRIVGRCLRLYASDATHAAIHADLSPFDEEEIRDTARRVRQWADDRTDDARPEQVLAILEVVDDGDGDEGRRVIVHAGHGTR